MFNWNSFTDSLCNPSLSIGSFRRQLKTLFISGLVYVLMVDDVKILNQHYTVQCIVMATSVVVCSLHVACSLRIWPTQQLKMIWRRLLSRTVAWIQRESSAIVKLISQRVSASSTWRPLMMLGRSVHYISSFQYGEYSVRKTRNETNTEVLEIDKWTVSEHLP